MMVRDSLQGQPMLGKAELKKALQQQIDASLNMLGFVVDKRRAAHVIQTPIASVRFSYAITAAGYPKNIVSLDATVFIDIAQITTIATRLFALPEVHPATLWGNLRLFTPANSAQNSSYYFDGTKDYQSHLDKFIKDMGILARFAHALTSLDALSNKSLARLPLIRNNFEGGLGWDYKYGLPQEIAIIHALNREFDDARLCAEHSGHLSAEEKAALLQFIAAQEHAT